MYEHRVYSLAPPASRTRSLQGTDDPRAAAQRPSSCADPRSGSDETCALTLFSPGGGVPRRPSACAIGLKELSEADTLRADGMGPSGGGGGGGHGVTGVEMDTAIAEEGFSSMSPTRLAPLALLMQSAKSRLYTAVACVVLYHAFLLFAIARHWAEGPDMCHPVWLLALATLLVLLFAAGRLLLKRYATTIMASADALRYRERMPKVWLSILVVGVSLLVYDARDHLSRLTSLGGILVLLAINYALSSSRKTVPWLVLARALVLQYVAAALMLRWSAGRTLVVCVSQHIRRFLKHASGGSQFFFGYLAAGANLSVPGGGILLPDNGRNDTSTLLPILAFSAMPVIFYVGFCVNVLYYWGIMQAIVSRLGGFLNQVVGSTACESICAAGNLILGPEQSTLMLHPYLPHVTKAELHCFLTSGFASMSSVMLGSYIALGVDTQHLVTAAVLAAPSSLLFSKLLFPETEELRVVTVRIYTHSSTDTSMLEAGAKGAMACLALVGGILANIVAFMAFIHFLNAIFRWAAEIIGLRDVTFEKMLGRAFTPLALSMGVPWQDCADVGEVIGIKVVANEFIAYQSLLAKKLDARSSMLATYALSGFGNLCSMGVMLGSLAALCPRRLSDASEVAFRALWAGCSASIFSACVAGGCERAPASVDTYDCYNIYLEVDRKCL
ncbi:hypothetical protein HPB49_020007 [Dermacentor silvarum]|uniref:Uncharacterized protein n=1 Tax=Dermacentor silvarum TaxID=543639 RepID=A0ACB8CZN6_DERSI|nr:hypothetical protein HPB49_020007 [Dermacentor silvarum]